jgi:hypothetical protein
MFERRDSVSNSSLTMDETFNLPQNLIKADRNFCRYMFHNCGAANFRMNQVFNLPQNLTSVGYGFAYGMFAGCRGDSFTMNEVFNLPQGITSIGYDFAQYLFYDCRGAYFQVNDVFTFPPMAQSELDKNGMFTYTLSGIRNTQKRSAVSIINNPSAPPEQSPTIYPYQTRSTFVLSGHRLRFC